MTESAKTASMREKPTILIVDDESFYTEMLAGLLHDDYQVSTVGTGEEALAYVNEHPNPDLMLLDIILPGCDGYEVCRRLKANVSSKNFPIIFLTVKRDIDDELKGFNLGAVDYITKPVSPPIVLARVRTHVNLSRVRRQLEVMLKRLGD